MPGQTVEIGQWAQKRLPFTAFTAPVTFTRSGTPAEPIIFKGMAAGPDGVPELKPSLGITSLTFRDVHDITVESLGISYGGNANGVDVKGSSDITLDGISLAGSGPAGAQSAPVRIDDRSSAVTLSRVAFRAASIGGQWDDGVAESFRLGGPPVTGLAQRKDGIRSADASPGMGMTPQPFGFEIFPAPSGAWCQPVHCWGAPFTYTVDYGDGTPALAVTAGHWISHSYKSDGVYLVSLTVTGSDGSQQTFFTMAYEEW
jgi:hypothetical protein